MRTTGISNKSSQSLLKGGDGTGAQGSKFSDDFARPMRLKVKFLSALGD